MAMFLWQMLVILLILICFTSSISGEYIVYPEGQDCPTPAPCLTLRDYVDKYEEYFVSNSSFLFLPGQHHLNSTIYIWPTPFVDSLTLRGDPSGEAVIIMAHGSIFMRGGMGYSILNLKIIVTVSTGGARGGIEFFECGSFTISSTYFLAGPNCQALHVSRSGPGSINNCSFHGEKNDSHISGGAISTHYADINFLDITISGINVSQLIQHSQSSLTFRGKTQFINNSNPGSSGGALSLSITTIRLSGKVEFIGNSAESGGAMFMDIASFMEFQEPLELVFKNNSAVTGGALTTTRDSINQCQHGTINTCFFRMHSVENISLIFEDNYAEAGSAIYGGDLEYCIPGELPPELNSTIGLDILKNISIFSGKKDDSIISSDPLGLCYCNDGMPACSEEQESLVIDSWPGRNFNLVLAAVGQVGGVTPSIVEIHNYPVIHEARSPAGCANFTLRVLKVNEDHLNHSIQVRLKECPDKVLNATVLLGDCPNGFELVGKACGCDKLLIELGLECDTDTGLITKTDYSYWVEPILNETGDFWGIIWSNNCPTQYCKQSLVTMNFSSISDSDNQCREYRTGVLCGQCMHNYSFTLGNLACRKCGYLDFLGLLVFFAFAGVGLIVLLLVTDMTVASGTLNGLILYANVVKVYKDTFFPFETSINPLGVFISWLNLDFGISTCFYDGLDAYQYFWLQYAFPLYLWFLIGVVILASNCSIRVGNLLARSDPVAVLATVILMSYTKLLVTTIEILKFTELHNSTGPGTIIWVFDGDSEYLKGHHLIHAIVAACVIVLLLFPYIFLLTFGYHLHAYTDRRGFRWFEKIALFLKSYYAPFKRNTRYWTGFLLVFRIALFTGFLVSRGDVFAVPFVFMVLTGVSWLNKGTYNNYSLDLLELLFAINICILSSGTYYINTYGGHQDILFHSCLSFAFVEFLGIVAFHIFHRIRTLRCMKQNPEDPHVPYPNPQAAKAIVPNAGQHLPLLDGDRRPSSKKYT